MATLPPLNLNRNILSSITGGNPEAIKQLENLFASVENLSSGGGAAEIIAGNASAQSAIALALINQLQQLVDLAVLAPIQAQSIPEYIPPSTQAVTCCPGFYIQVETPAAGFSIDVIENWQDVWLLLQPAGALANGTVVLPDADYAPDGREVLVTSTQAIAALTTTGPNAASVNGAPAALTTNGTFRVKFCKQTDAWYSVA